jgi:hypothetical protein
MVMFSAFGTAEPRPLKVGVIGDQTGSDDLGKSYEVLARGVEILKVRLSFEGEQGEQYVEGLAAATISACSQ